MKKLIVPMIVGGIIGHIITKQQNKIAILTKDLKSSKTTIQETLDYLKKDLKKDYSNIRRSGRYPWADRNEKGEIILQTRKEAEDVLSFLVDIIKDYEIATIADLYDLIGFPSSYTDTMNGWKDLSEAKIIRTKHGYMLDLPWAVYKSHEQHTL